LQEGDADTDSAFRLQRKRWALRLLPLAAAGAAAAAVLHLALRNGWTLQTLAAHHKELQAHVAEHRVLALIVYLAVYTMVASLSLPGCVVLSVTGGLLFGWLAGTLAAVAGATSGATLFFLLARTSLGDIFARRAGAAARRFRAGFQKDALSYMLFLRLTPAFPFGVVNIAAAFLNVRLRDFTLGTFIGIIPATLIFSTAGAQIERVLAAKQTAHEQCVQNLVAAGLLSDSEDACAAALTLTDLMTWEAFLLLAVLGVFALIPVFAKKLRKNTQGDA
jgi:uncharacterized membrane protein YdjX (TVP38/TMEM64 family)